jgi:hypothetical protein
MDDDSRSEEWALAVRRVADAADRCVLAFKRLSAAVNVVAIELREVVSEARGEVTPSHEIAECAVARARGNVAGRPDPAP